MDGTNEAVVLGNGRCKIVLHPPQKSVPNGLGHDIDVVARPFQGSIAAVAWLNPWPHVRRELAKLYETLRGTVAVQGYENFELTLTGDGRGHITARVSAIGDHYAGIVLKFEFGFDQTELPRIIREIQQTFCVTQEGDGRREPGGPAAPGKSEE